MKEGYLLVKKMKPKISLLRKEGKWKLKNTDESKNNVKNKDKKCN